MQLSSGHQALWAPCFRRSFIVSALYAHTALLALLAFLLPAHAPAGGVGIAQWLVRYIADVRWMASVSSFPFATTIGYALAMLGALGLALLTGFTTIDLQAYRRILASKAALTRLILFALALLFLATPYLRELKVGDHQFSKPFFTRASSNRFALLFWVEGIFFFFYVSWLLVFVEFTTFVAPILKRN